MNDISSLIKKAQKETDAATTQLVKKRKFINVSTSNFKSLFIAKATKIITEDGFKKEFNIDDNNIFVLNQLYYWLIGDTENFKGHNIFKGICLCGPYGTGKTVIMEAFCSIYQDLTNYVVPKINSVNLDEYIKEYGFKPLERNCLFIDELGKETKEIKDYGTIKEPMKIIITSRDNNNSLTFATTNYYEEDLKTIYGNYIATRIAANFNMYKLEGNSRRPKLQIIG